MYKLISKLVIYRNFEKDSILFELADICKQFDYGDYEAEDLSDRILEQIHKLMDLATFYGFNHNLWHNYLSFLLATTENPFTLVTEKTGAVEGTVNEFAINDLNIFRQLFLYDFSKLENALNLNCFSLICNYQSVAKKEQFYNKNVSIRVQELSNLMIESKDTNEMYNNLMGFYKHYGVGKFGMNKAFRISSKEGDGLIVPIVATSPVTLDDLVGYDRQKNELIANTEAFLNGKVANNVLLHGDAGTGKSTCIKSLLNLYYDRGLRIIEIYKHEFQYLPEIISIIKSRNYRFIIYMDDLSFESCETEYKYLKAVIEGDLEVKPDNVLIYATSNRQHLIKETFTDRKEMEIDDVHRSDTMAERLSLADRFGVRIGYYNPKREDFHAMVLALAKKHSEIQISDEELIVEANKWEIQHGGPSGRVAQQFVNHMVGKSI